MMMWIVEDGKKKTPMKEEKRKIRSLLYVQRRTFLPSVSI